VRFDVSIHAGRGTAALYDPTTIEAAVSRRYEEWTAHRDAELGRCHVFAYVDAADTNVTFRVLVDERPDPDLERRQEGKKELGTLHIPSGRLAASDIEVAGIAWERAVSSPAPEERTIEPGTYEVTAFVVIFEEDDDGEPYVNPPNAAIYLRRIGDVDLTGRRGARLFAV
jgi:hypothetical protein